MDIRRKSVVILKEIIKEDAYSNVALSRNLTMATPSERRTVTQLVYGVLENKLLLEHIVKEYAQMRLSKIKVDVRIVLLLSIYQLMFMDSIPDRAVVDEGVKLAGDVHDRYKNFVNGILRSFIRSNKKYTLPKNKLERASIESSTPMWLLELWKKNYGEKQTIKMAMNSIKPPTLTFRTNTLKATREEVMDSLRKQGYECEIHNGSPEAINVTKVGNVPIGDTDSYLKGWFIVQDSSSQAIAHFMDLENGQRVLDMCSAPGGKTTHIATLLANTGQVIAHDIYDHKCERIKEHCQRLGLTNVDVSVMDATQFEPSYIEGFDRVLVDAPCSGLGIIRRKPDIKFRKGLDDIEELVKIQEDILNNAAKYVKKGGYLVYSTCTLNPVENEKQLEKFLAEHEEYQPVKLSKSHDYKVTLINESGDDGFFVGVLQRL